MATESVAPSANVQQESLPGGGCRLHLQGHLSSTTLSKVWASTREAVLSLEKPEVEVDCSGLTYLDSSGISVFIRLDDVIKQRGGSLKILSMPEELRPVFDLFRGKDFAGDLAPVTVKASLPVEVGQATAAMLQGMGELVTFTGEMLAATGYAIMHPRTLRWRDLLRTAETAGVNAFGIVVLIGFLIGLILALQSAGPMRQFGAELYIADLVAIAMLRELGPLMTAVMLTGRSASAFAAEMGTMKVNEEINALVTMGLDPVRFLAVPRLIAAVAMTPFLTVFANLAGLVGGAIVMMSLGFPLITYYNEVLSAVSLGDFVTGIFKAFLFGVLVAGVGCLRGLQTKSGATAVGDSTTSAVVSGIILIVIVDGIFAALFYTLGI